MDEEKYLTDRLEDQLVWYDNKSQYNQRWFKRLRLFEIVCASLIPLLSGLSDFVPFSTWVMGGLGVVIAISAAVSSLYKFQENWIQYRTTAETLKHEKFLYLAKAAPYHHENSFKMLVARVEGIISKENSSWSSYVKSAESEPKDA